MLLSDCPLGNQMYCPKIEMLNVRLKIADPAFDFVVPGKSQFLGNVISRHAKGTIWATSARVSHYS